MWYSIASLACIFNAGYIFANQLLKLDANIAMFYRGLGLFVMLLPFAFFIPPVENVYFYIFAVIQGLLIYANDSRIFRLSKTSGAEITSVYQPLTVMVIFLLWTFLNPRELAAIKDNLSYFFIELTCLAFISFAVLKIKKAKASKKDFPLIFPLIALGTVIDLMNKQLMTFGGQNLLSSIYYYNLITAFVVGIFSITRFKKQETSSSVFSKRNFLFGLCVIVIVFSLTSLKNLAMFFTPNPGYVSAIMGIIPLWVVAFNFISVKFFKTGAVKTIDTKYIFVLVFFIIIMILSSTQH